jgi:hypothetical protein
MENILMSAIVDRYDYGNYESLDALMNAVMRDARLNAEDTVYILAKAMEASNAKVAAYNSAAEFWTSYVGNYDADGDGEVSQQELDDWEAANGPIPWPWDYYDPNPPSWLESGTPTAQQAEDYASYLANLATTEADKGALIMTELQAANNELDEADRVHTAWIEQIHQTRLAVISNI